MRVWLQIFVILVLLGCDGSGGNRGQNPGAGGNGGGSSGGTTNGPFDQSTDGVVYSQSGQELDLCLPSGAQRAVSIILIHGGGFSTGDRNQMKGYCDLFAQGGFTSVTVSYRLTSQGHPYPAAADDVRDAVAWMRRNANSNGFDPEKIVLLGYSAGATLALTVGLTGERGVAGIIDIAGPTDFAALRATTTFAQLRQDIDAYLGSASPAEASPISYVSSDDPPVRLFHGRVDELVPLSQATTLRNLLSANSVDFDLRIFDTGTHGIFLPDSQQIGPILQDITLFLLSLEGP